MKIKNLHFISGLVITIFIGIHLFNHVYSIFGVDKHIEMMTNFRYFYRNTIVEIILILAVSIQIISGFKLFRANRKIATSNFDKLHLWTGLYLAIFFIIHLSAVFGGRFFLKLDTNFYFGVAGINSFPINLLFIPYYALAIISFFGHLACVHNKKMKNSVFGLTPKRQSIVILIFGICFTILIFYGLTNYFHGVEIPKEYKILTGQ